MLTASNKSSVTSNSNDALLASNGLTHEEVLKRREEYGYNQIETPKGESAFLKFIRHFISLMAILLWVGGFVAFFFTDTPQLGIAIWLVNVINGLFSFFQESKASKATEALKKMLSDYALSLIHI